MKASGQGWRVGWRLALCAALLLWICHAIFMREAHLAWERGGGGAWTELGRAQQWQLAWSRGPRELWHTVSLVRPFELFLSVLFMGLTVLLGVLRWRMVLGVLGLELPLGRATAISFVAHFFNSFLLGSTGGDVLKAYYAARETHHKKPEAVATVFVDRLIGLLSMLLFAAIMMVPNRALMGAHGRLAALAGVILVMLAVGLGLAGLAFRGGLSRTFPQARAWLRRLPKGVVLERSLDACRQFGRAPGVLLGTMALSMVLNAVCVMQIWALARGMNLRLDPVALFVLVPVVICLAAIPITPSGLGVRENLYVWMFAVPEINVDPTSALSLSLLAYAGSLLWSAVGGLVYLGLRDRHHLAEVTASPPRGGPGDP